MATSMKRGQQQKVYQVELVVHRRHCYHFLALCKWRPRWKEDSNLSWL